MASPKSVIVLLTVVLCATCGSPPIPTAPQSGAPSAPPPASPTHQPTEVPTATPDPLAPADQQILRVYCCVTDPRSLEPQAASGSDEISVINGTQRALLYRDGDGNLVPSLAIALPTVSADGLT